MPTSAAVRVRHPGAWVVAAVLLIIGGILICLWGETRSATQSPGGAVAETRHVSGLLQPDDALEDPAFGVRSRALALRRTVEVFHEDPAAARPRPTAADTADADPAVQREKAPLRGNWEAYVAVAPVGGGAAEAPAASAFGGEIWRAGLATLEGLQVDAEIVAAVDGWQPLAMDPRDLAPNLAATFVLVDGKLLSSADPAAPQDGDLRISWSQVPAQPVSVIAQQSEERLQPFEISVWSEPFVLVPGTVDRSAMPPVIRSSGRAGGLAGAWPFRVLAVGLFWLGLHLLFRSLRAFMRTLPVLGPLASGALWVGSLLTAVAVTSVTVLLVDALVQN